MAGVSGPPGLSDHSAFQLWKLGWWIERRTEDAVAALGISGRDYLVLGMAGASGGISQQEMATFMSLDPTSMVAIVDGLEEAGLSRRERDPADRRRYLVKLTPKGRRLLARADAAFEAIEEDLLGPLSVAERTAIGDMADRVMERYWSANVSSKRPSRRA
jgi:DNA-binding MarR family transcriptional regulator